MLGSLIISGLGYLLTNPWRKAARVKAKRAKRGDRVAKRLIREIISEEGAPQYSRRHRVRRARLLRRGASFGDIFRFNRNARRASHPKTAATRALGKAGLSRNPSAREAGAAYYREHPQHHFSRAMRYATETGQNVQAFMDGWTAAWKPTPLSARTLASGKTKRNPNTERDRCRYLRDAVELAKARAPLRQIVALTHAAARIRKLTDEEIQRVVDARKVGHIKLNPRRRSLRNPPRDPRFAGTFDHAHPPQVSRAYADGDTAAVSSPYKAGTWEIWVFGMVDPGMGDTWNLVSKGHRKDEAIREAMALAK